MHCTDKQKQDCPMADDAAERAVKKVFAILGVDIEKPESVAEFQADLRFGKSMRNVAGKGTVAFVVLVVGVLVGLIGYGAIAKVKGLL